MHANLSKGLVTAPVATVLPQTGDYISPTVKLMIGMMLIVLVVTLVMVQVKKRSNNDD